MGFFFKADHGNLAVFLTTPAAEAPRVQRTLLVDFLGGLVDASHRAEGNQHEPDREGAPRSELISLDMNWIRRIGAEARHAREVAAHLPVSAEDDSGAVTPTGVRRILGKLSRLFSQFRLYALVFGRTPSGEDISPTLRQAAVRLAYSGEDVLVLFPMGQSEGLPTLDALPAYALALEQQECWPGILFWTPHGSAAFAREGVAIEAATEFSRGLSNQSDADLDRAVDQLADRPPRRILHLSDLHFGSEDASLNVEYAEAELADVCRSMNRIVITGDLLDTPNEDAAANFRRFANTLYRSSSRPALIVPGNHDTRWHGNAFGPLGQDLSQAVQFAWSPHLIDDELRTIFFGFNSSIRGKFARGYTGERQRTRLASDHRTALGVRPELRDYLTVALIHHHPYSFETSASTWYQQLLASFRLSDEPTLKMVDADDFIEWCARWRVSAILHGHKHVPRYESRVITPTGSAPHEVTAVGCGSTLGAEGSPLSYCVLTWDPRSVRWSAAFWESRGSGPFVPKLITVTREPGVAAAA